MANDVLVDESKAGESVIVIGGGSIGCETALHLAQRGKRVTIVEALDRVATDMLAVDRMHLMKLLSDYNVSILTGTKVLGIKDKSVSVVNEGGRRMTLDADTVVIAAGLKSNDGLLGVLEDTSLQVYAVGDCVQPRKVINAIREAFRRARLI